MSEHKRGRDYAPFACLARLAEKQRFAALQKWVASAALSLKRLRVSVRWQTWSSFCSMCYQRTWTGAGQEVAEIRLDLVLASAAGLPKVLRTLRTVFLGASC